MPDQSFVRWKAIALSLFPLPIALGLTLAVYFDSMSAGFMFDDPFDLRRASGRSFIQILTDAGEHSYFRPVPLIVWKLAHLLVGRHDPAILHALALAIHAANGWLVYQLGRRLMDALSGVLAMALFVLFPLSYQVVSIVNSFFHALVTTWILVAILLYWDWRTNPERTAFDPRLVIAAASAFLAMLTHENGLASVALILLAETALLLSLRINRLSFAPAVFAGLAAVYLAIWSIIPRWRSEWSVDPDSLKMNGLYFLQGITYPVSGQLGGVSLSQSAAEVIVVTGVLTLSGLAVTVLIRNRLLTLSFGVGWFIVAVFLAWLLLPWSYVINGPRLMYLASIGSAIAWAAAISPTLPVRSADRFAGAALGLLFAALILVTSSQFIVKRSQLQAQGAAMVWQLADTATLQGPETGRLYVNLPSWISFKRQEYLLGHTGISLIPDYIGLWRSVYVHSGAQPKIISLTYPDIAGEWDHHYATHGKIASLDELETAIRQGGGVYLNQFLPGQLKLDYVGRLEPRDSINTTELARFDDWAVLERTDAWREGNRIAVNLVWRAIKSAPPDFTVFLHLVGESDELIAQADGYVIGGMLPPSRWQSGDRIEDRRYIELTESNDGVPKRMLIGMYDRASGARAPATASDGAPYQDNAVPIDLDLPVLY